MYHDTEKIGCNKRDGDKLHVMTPTFEADTVGVAWSRCSRRDITNFLEYVAARLVHTDIIIETKISLLFFCYRFTPPLIIFF